MRFLTLEEVYYLHELALRKAGGRAGIRDFTLVHSALMRPQATFGGKELYSTIYLKAAAPIHSLILNHPFEDGNKRTGFFSLNAFLWKNGIRLMYTKAEGKRFCLGVEDKSFDLDKIALWIKKHARKMR